MSPGDLAGLLRTPRSLCLAHAFYQRSLLGGDPRIKREEEPKPLSAGEVKQGRAWVSTGQLTRAGTAKALNFQTLPCEPNYRPDVVPTLGGAQLESESFLRTLPVCSPLSPMSPRDQETPWKALSKQPGPCPQDPVLKQHLVGKTGVALSWHPWPQTPFQCSQEALQGHWVPVCVTLDCPSAPAAAWPERGRLATAEVPCQACLSGPAGHPNPGALWAAASP